MMERIAEIGRQMQHGLVELEKQLTDWLEQEAEQQMQSLLEQLCSATAVAPAGVAVWLITRRRR
jgi:hypothetical protein